MKNPLVVIPVVAASARRGTADGQAAKRGRDDARCVMADDADGADLWADGGGGQCGIWGPRQEILKNMWKVQGCGRICLSRRFHLSLLYSIRRRRAGQAEDSAFVSVGNLATMRCCVGETIEASRGFMMVQNLDCFALGIEIDEMGAEI